MNQPTLGSPELRLRAFHRSDRRAWDNIRRANVTWLQEWDATVPCPDPTVPRSFGAMVRSLRQDARDRRAYSYAVEVGDELVGQVTLGGVAWGSLRSGNLGYWLSQHAAGRGIGTRAVGLLADFAFDKLNLHRLEISMRPTNVPSRRVAEKLGFTYESFRPAYMHINGQWRDHYTYVSFNSHQPGAVSRQAELNAKEISGNSDI